MDYSKMTVAELKALCDKEGLEYPSNVKKAELVGYLEKFAGSIDEKPIEVEAEVIETEHIELVPAKIDARAYLASRRKRVAEMMEPYRDMTDEAICAMDAKEAKACRADLNHIIKEVEDERKAIKNAYNAPLEAFESAVREIIEPAKRDEKRLKQYIDDQVSVQRDMRRMSLVKSYEIYAPALVPVVPFELIMQKTNPKWLNASYSGVKATEELEEAVNRIARDWETLKSQKDSMRFYDEAEAEFFRTLDVASAIEMNNRRTEEAARIEAMKAEVEANREASAQVSAHVPEQIQAQKRVEMNQERKPERKRYRFSVLLADYELASLREWKNAAGIGADWKFGEV